MAEYAAASPQQEQQDRKSAFPSVVTQRKKQRLQFEDNRPNRLVQRQAHSTGLPDNLKSGMENLSGMSLDHVRVHRNSDKPAAVQAHAYAQGSDIHLASGQEHHLPHELGHVVQQAQGLVKPTTSVGGMAVNDNAGLESHATALGNKALQRASVGQGFCGHESADQSIMQLKVKDADNIMTLKALKRSHVAFTGEIDELLKDTTAEKDIKGVIDELKKWDWAGDDAAKTAYLTEIENKGHTLFRHGPHLEQAQLDERLTSDTIFGEPAPASKGDGSYATKFSDYKGINDARTIAIDTLNQAKNTMIDDIEPKVAEFILENTDLVDALPANRGPKFAPAKKACKEMTDKCKKYLNDSGIAGNFRLKNEGVAAMAGMDKTVDPRGSWKFFDAYEVVIQSPAAIGEGRKKVGANPVENMAEVKGVKASYKTTWDKTLKGNANKADLFTANNEFQFFPDNGVAGILGRGYH
ncbi:MAG: hypothetical protein ACI8WB_001250 [Phenylobacterium sp.]|jgi:hypothetical protein